jgi:hypothetical protein
VQILDSNVDELTQVPYHNHGAPRWRGSGRRLAAGAPSTDDRVLRDVCAASAGRTAWTSSTATSCGNIFTDGDDGPLCKVLDFGVVKRRIWESTAAYADRLYNVTLETLYYMSRDRSATPRVDHRADLWSIGVVAYECMTGRRPFRGESLHG